MYFLWLFYSVYIIRHIIFVYYFKIIVCDKFFNLFYIMSFKITHVPPLSALTIIKLLFSVFFFNFFISSKPLWCLLLFSFCSTLFCTMSKHAFLKLLSLLNIKCLSKLAASCSRCGLVKFEFKLNFKHLPSN